MAAAVQVQAWFRGVLGRYLAARQRARVEQRRLEDEQDRALRAKREAAALAALQAEEAAKRDEEAKKEAHLKAFRDRRCAIEQMCQGLAGRTSAGWEEDPAQLLEMLDQRGGCTFEVWLGRQATRRLARKEYLALARRWHPDKWALQGEHCTSAATEVTKALVRAYDQAMRELPQETGIISCEDEDEEREVYEFASWVGVAFEGMFEVWKERRGVTAGR